MSDRAIEVDHEDGGGCTKRPDGLLTTGDMARITGNTLRTVRFYEEAGMLHPQGRSSGGHRLFSRRELERLEFIRDMRSAGLSLDEIRALLELKTNATNAPMAASQAQASLQLQSDLLKDKIEALTRLRDGLEQARATLTKCLECDNERCFPDACDECEVMQTAGQLPQSLRVLWDVGGIDTA